MVAVRDESLFFHPVLSCYVLVHSGRAEGGLPPCAGIEAGNFQRVVLFSAFVLEVR